jgi:flagellar basal body-associated protein FliL
MQNKLQQLEDKINALLLAIWAGIVAIIHKIIPQKFFTWLANSKAQSKSYLKKKIEQFKDFIIKLKNKIITFKDFVMAKIDAIQKLPIKEKAQFQVTILKEYLLNTPLKSHVLWFSEKFSVYWEKFSSIVNKVGKQQLTIAFTAMLMITAGIFSIYDSSRDIYNSEFISRAPASAQVYDEKPAYHMYQRKTAIVLKIQIPIFREDVKQVRNITVDFTVRTSTRFAKQYLEYHTQKLKDYFYTTVEPVTASFPLEEEGKSVLKEKIHYELNNFLLEENVEGVVEEVNLIYSVGY